MSSTAEELASQAEQLQGTVAFFKIGEAAAPRKTGTGQPGGAKAPEKIRIKHIVQTGACGTLPGKALVNASGVGLDLGEACDRLDHDFEKY
jgi:methyl-accepting chemotaxis protein